MTEHPELQQLRDQIDAVDASLLANISERGRLAQQVAKVKGRDNPDEAFYRPEREAQVLRRICQQNPGPLSDEEIKRLFREVMSACLALEKQLDIGYLGPAGTFTQGAALKHFGHSVKTSPLGTIQGVFQEVESGGCDFGVVPVENSIEGVVNHTLDTFMDSPLKICGEVELRIHHYLLAPGGELADINRVYAHQQALAQCRRWLDQHLPQAERVALNSNAEAARRVAEQPGCAAIAGEAAAELYDLHRLAANIEDEAENTTRFLIIGRDDSEPSGEDKTSMIFSTPNRPGALYVALGIFADNGISMLKIESRPSRRGTWEYSFFVDIEGHQQDPDIAKALDAMQERVAVLKVLGSYPRAAL